MDSSGKRIPAGWSFVGGALLGALGAVALPASIHTARSQADGSGGEGRFAIASALSVPSDVPVPAQRPDLAETSVAPSERKLAGHSELELQPD